MYKEELKILYDIFESLVKFYGPRNWWPAKTQMEVIVGAILTQNTAWKNVERAIVNLRRQGLLSAHRLYQVRTNRLARLIRPSGYYNIKAQRLKNFLTFLYDRHQGSLKKMFNINHEILRKELLMVKGLGQETVDSILLYAGGKPVFVIDAYTKRIFSRHGLIGEKDSYEKIQKMFIDNLKPDIRLYNEYHALIVELGKNVCRRKPKCSSCPLKKVFEKKYA